MRIVVTGPPGSGKSLVGAALAAALKASFVDGEDVHGSGAADDAQRMPWLDAVASALVRSAPAVAACPALLRSDRDRMRATCADAWFVELVVATTPAPHDAGESLTTDEAGMRVDAAMDLETLVAQVVSVWSSRWA
ncbi:gluconokinase [Microbacterium sp.]|uniref:gluconokinase n=1 Tax=Microbacterium sp. TaxID=51671 RepID=UPI003A8C4848